jgi:RimJ/RimL family protein N-acetyltransferase
MEHQAGRQLLQAVKASASPRQPALSLPVGFPVEAVLRPVATRGDCLNDADVRVLTEWRNRFVEAFLTEFQANEMRTARWLTNIVATDDTRILFMVDDARSGDTIGYMGLAFIDWENLSGEADAIVRGREAAPGLMKRAMRTMLDWAHSQLGLKTLGVRVRSDNPAVEFYRKFGFRELRRVTLRRVNRADMIEWLEDESLPMGEPSLVHMTLEDRGTGEARVVDVKRI